MKDRHEFTKPGASQALAVVPDGFQLEMTDGEWSDTICLFGHGLDCLHELLRLADRVEALEADLETTEGLKSEAQGEVLALRNEIQDLLDEQI